MIRAFESLSSYAFLSCPYMLSMLIYAFICFYICLYMLSLYAAPCIASGDIFLNLHNKSKQIWIVITLLPKPIEQSIFRFLRFLFFELQLIVFTIFGDPRKKNSFKSWQIYGKDAQCSETDFLVLDFFLFDFRFFCGLLWCIWPLHQNRPYLKN